MNAAVSIARDGVATLPARAAHALARFAEPYRPAISRLANRHPRLADLANSFPALLFAIAVSPRGFDPERVIARVIAGQPLAELAALARVPMWTRKLHPRILTAPLPVLPDSPSFARQIGNHLPLRNRQDAPWLDVIADAARWGHDDLAVWFARHYASRDASAAILRRHAIAAWAWHCRSPDAPASAMLGVRWAPGMSCNTALDLFWRWIPAISFQLLLHDRDIVDHWAIPATVDGFAFAPIYTALELASVSGLSVPDDKLNSPTRTPLM